MADTKRNRPASTPGGSEKKERSESTTPAALNGRDRKLHALADLLTEQGVARRLARRVVVVAYNRGWDFIEPFSDEDLEFLRSSAAMRLTPLSTSVEETFGAEVAS